MNDSRKARRSPAGRAEADRVRFDANENVVVGRNAVTELLKSGRLCPYDKYYLKQRIQFAHRVGSAANAVWTQTGFIRSVLKHFSNGLKMADVFHMPKNSLLLPHHTSSDL